MTAEELVIVCASGDHEKVIELLSTHPEESFFDFKSRDGKTVLEIATCFGRLLVIQELVKSGAPIDHVSERGYNLIHWAATWGHLDVVKYFVDAGVQILQKNVHNETAKQIAERYRKDDCAMYLHRAELFHELKNLALKYKDVIADPEKNMGKFNKEDKVHGNRHCDEKIDWIEQNRDMANVQQITDKITELREQLHNTMSKLEDD